MKAVCLPFNIGCGHCKNCERGLTAYCLRANEPGTAGGGFGGCHGHTSWPYQVLVFFNARGADYGSIKGGRTRPGI